MINSLRYRMKLSDNKTKKYFRYIIVGGITTLVNFCVFILLSVSLGVEPNISNTFAILAAVIFAYISNKVFVFKSISRDITHVLKEFLTFFLSRGFTMLIEILGLFLLHNILNVNSVISKLLVTVVVLILNYIFMQHLVFSETKQ